MRLLLRYRMESEFLPKDYRKLFVSFFKKSLTEYMEGVFFDEFYNADVKKNTKKDFSWSVKLEYPKFYKNRIEVLGKSMELVFVCPDKLNTLLFLNAFINQKFKKIPISEENSISLEMVKVLKDREIKGNVLDVKMLSPLVIRDHNKDNNTDKYFCAEDEEFIDRLKENLSRAFPEFEKEISELKLDISRLKKVVVLLYGQYFNASIGSMLFIGDNNLLKAMYEKSIGSRKSSGFGVMEYRDSWEVRM